MFSRIETKIRELNTMFQIFKNKKQVSDKILDTSILIDGRIIGLIESGFLEGKIIIPQFVLYELQNVADDNEELKRKRGKRGLHVLSQIQSITNIEVYTKESEEIKNIKEVDKKLVSLCKELDAKLVTVDFNLNKVAKIQGVTVLNVNEIILALRLPINIGDSIWVRILKKGEQKNQGVGYLDDGTMIIVDNGEQSINERVNVFIRHIQQTASSRIVFAKLYSEN